MTSPRKKPYARVIVWMRRGLRVNDFAPLVHALHDAVEVLPVVCLQEGGRFAEDTPRRRYLRGALNDLDHRLRSLGSALYVLRGTPEEALPRAAEMAGVDAVFAAAVADLPTQQRDGRIATALARTDCTWVTFQDAVLFDKEEILTASGTPYRVYTPYKHSWLSRIEDAPPPFPDIRRVLSPVMRQPFVPLADIEGFRVQSAGGGETAARDRLQRFIRRSIHRYRASRDFPAVDGTSRLSADLANGTISIRTVLRAARKARQDADREAKESIDAFIGELIWREFYYQILGHFPFVVERAFKEELAGLRWAEDQERFAAWCEGRTGYPIVDAAMRQLNTEGWMHNRARMITASFLTKDLHINWQWGEQYFRRQLIDADVASNNGGWQWCAGTGTDASPYYRIFNPVLQGRKFDPDGAYVRRYVPELHRMPTEAIHTPWMASASVQQGAHCIIRKDYPRPIVDHAAERKVALAMYRVPSRRGLSTTVRRHV